MQLFFLIIAAWQPPLPKGEGRLPGWEDWESWESWEFWEDWEFWEGWEFWESWEFWEFWESWESNPTPNPLPFGKGEGRLPSCHYAL